MGKVSQLFEQHIPIESIKKMYSRLSHDDVEALYNDNLDKLSPAGKKEVRAADDFVQSKREMENLQQKQQELQSPTSGWRGAARDVAGIIPSALTGVARGATDIANLPANIAQSISGNKVLPTIPQPASLASSLNVEPSGIAEALGSFVPSTIGGEAAMGAKGIGKLAEMLPSSAGGALSKAAKSITPEIRGQAASGGLYGASQNQNDPLSGAAEGALIGGGLAGIGNVIAPQVAKGITSFLSAPLARKAADMMGRNQGVSAIQSALGNAYKTSLDKSKGWSDAMIPVAKEADSSGIPFNTEHYVGKAKELLENLQPKIDRIPEKYGDAGEVLQKLIDNPPRSYEDSTYVNELINDVPKTWGATNDPSQGVLRNISGKMGDALKTQVDKNAVNNPSAQSFASHWKDQRENYKNLRNFSNVATKRNPDGSLSLSYSKSQDSKMGESPDADIVKHFLPTASKQSTAQMHHLGNLLGSKSKAANAIKNDYMAKAFKDGDFDHNIAISQYRKLSPEQRDFIFTKNENKMFSAASKAKNISSNRRLVTFLKNHSVSSLLGAGAGAHTAYQQGYSPLVGGALGALGAPALTGLAAKAFESPQGLAVLENLMRAGGSQKNITYPALAAILPQLLGNKG